MADHPYNRVARVVDGMLYVFIGPFVLLYIIPRFLIAFANVETEPGFGMPWVKGLGMVLMWSGAALAVWCTYLMNTFGRGTPLVTSAPREIVDRSVYGHVRNPMMWALILVVLGEVLTFGELILLLWLAAMCRILYLFVNNYEEPQLERRFGESWRAYCRKVPPWIPRVSPQKDKDV